jgi:DNA polymerase zeta
MASSDVLALPALSFPFNFISSMDNPSPALEVHVTQIDYSLNTPNNLDNTCLPKVPVLRIYGASSVGKKCCLHIHQVYPYFFVEYTGKISPGSGEQSIGRFRTRRRLISPIVRRYIARLTDSLNYAIAVSLKRDPQSPRSHYVRAVILVKGIHFYGFNSSYSPFLKIHIVDPALVSRAVAIMQSGSVMGTPFHTFESHLSFVLQFLCDYGLYGCGWIQLEDVWQRGVDDDVVVPTGPPFKPSVYFRQSRMALEFDTIAPLIMNRRNVSPRHLHHKLVIPQPPSSSEPLVLGVRELWDDERRRRAAAGLPPSPDLPQDPSANSREKGGAWAAEARWWDQLRQRIERDRDMELAVSNSGWERWIMTTFESVEALWEDDYRVWKPTREAQERNPYADSNGSSPQNINPVSRTSVEVDEALLSSQELSSLEEQGDVPGPNLGADDKDNLTDEEQVGDADAPSDIQVYENSRRGTPTPQQPQRPHMYDVPSPYYVPFLTSTVQRRFRHSTQTRKDR